MANTKVNGKFLNSHPSFYSNKPAKLSSNSFLQHTSENFGRPLYLCIQNLSNQVPFVIEKCANYIEMHGMEVEGLYLGRLWDFFFATQIRKFFYKKIQSTCLFPSKTCQPYQKTRFHSNFRPKPLHRIRPLRHQHNLWHHNLVLQRQKPQKHWRHPLTTSQRTSGPLGRHKRT